MTRRFRNNGFSLTEVLMATGILAIGFMFIAGAFPVGVKLTTMATEKTIGRIVANEAFAKIKLYGGSNIPPEEFLYPSADTGAEAKKYGWSFWRNLEENPKFVVFVNRKTSAAAKYPYRASVSDPWTTIDWPWRISIRLDPPGQGSGFTSEIEIDPADSALAQYVTEDSVLVKSDGALMRVWKREGTTLFLVESVDGDELGTNFWVIPPAVRDLPGVDPPPVTGRNPSVAVYQTVLSF